MWLFSADTLSHVPDAFGKIEAGDLTRYFPKPLTRITLFSIPLWRWFAIPFGLFIAVLTAFFLTKALMPLVSKLVSRVAGEHHERRITSLRAPLTVVVFAAAIRLFGSTGVSLIARQIWTDISELLWVFGVAWLLVRFSDILSASTTRRLVLTSAVDKVALLAFMRRLFKILVVIITFLLLLRRLGVNVTAMLAGLGIGGVAVALAAQKTLENFFGGIAIIMRDVIRVGDFCKIADQIGIIEDVGFSSTRVRTLDRTVVSVSNAQVSQTSIENYTMVTSFGSTTSLDSAMILRANRCAKCSMKSARCCAVTRSWNRIQRVFGSSSSATLR